MMKGAEPIFIDKKSKLGILMLHGFSSTPDEFRELSSYFADKGFTVSVPLLAGHGTSPEEMLKTNANDWANSAKEAYLKLKQKSNKVFLIGNSFGSDIIFWLAKEFNNEQEGIVSLGAPIFLRYHAILVLRLYTYGLVQRFYTKPPRLYKTDYTDMLDEVTYSKIPTKSVRQFLRFIKKEAVPILKKVKIPTLVIHSDNDGVISPKSATYIYQHLGSDFKRLHWFNSSCHIATKDANKSELFEKIFAFLEEVTKS